MIYARLGPDSDVAVYLDGEGLYRCAHEEGDDFVADEARAMLRHLDEHQGREELVPADALEELRSEAASEVGAGDDPQPEEAAR